MDVIAVSDIKMGPLALILCVSLSGYETLKTQTQTLLIIIIINNCLSCCTVMPLIFRQQQQGGQHLVEVT